MRRPPGKKVTPNRVRRRWAINPRTRVHDEAGYRRTREKAAERRRIDEEQQEDV